MRSTSKQAFVFSWVILIVTADVAWGVASAPTGTHASTTELMIVLDPRIPISQTTQNLANAGFLTVQRISGLPPRYSTYRIVSVASTAGDARTRLLAVNGVFSVRPVYRAQGLDYPILSNGQVIVKFKPGTPGSVADAMAASHQCTVARQIAGLPQAYVFTVTDPSKDPHGIAQTLAADSQVVYSHASLLFKLQKHAADIKDPFYPFQWHLNNTGQLPGGVPHADIDAEHAWDITLGNGARVGVIDDCLQKDHEDLRDNYFSGFDFLGSTPCDFTSPNFIQCFFNTGFAGIDASGSDSDPSPFFGPDPSFFDRFFDPLAEIGDFHGTCVAGIIAARDNDIGVRGVAPEAELIGCKIGLGIYFTNDQDVADAFLFAEANGAMAINNSWGFSSPVPLPVIPDGSFLLPDLVSDAITQVATVGRGGLGVLVLFSSGNASRLISFSNIYSTLPNVMSIGATLRDDRFACYSSFGPEQSVVAPGGGVSVPSDIQNIFFRSFPTCYDSDITTTDVMQIPGFIPFDLDLDGQFDPGYPIRGLNPPMKFLSVFDTQFCLSPLDLFCIPLVPDTVILDFPNPNYTQHMNGTSAACPVATGVAALVFSVNPNLSAVAVRNLIEHTADKPALIDESFDRVTGHNERYGHGRVNAFKAVQATVSGKAWPSPVKDIQNVSSQALVRLFWDNPDWDADGVIDEDVASVVVARGVNGQVDWAPTDGVEYTVGDIVAPGVVIVANTVDTKLDQPDLATGNYAFALFVRNATNYYSWGRLTSFSAESSTQKPLASISATPTHGPAPVKVHFAGGGIDKGGIVGFAWNFGDLGTAVGPAVDHTYTVGGTYLATLTVTNTGGQTAQASVQIVVTALPNSSPTVGLIATPTIGNAPLNVLFVASGKDSDGTVIDYDWNFGDRSTGSGATVDHVYLVPGTYAVSVTVTDNSGGTAVGTQVINVTGTGATAAQTSPPGILNTAPMSCGTGAGTAAIMSSMLLMALSVSRRRR